MPCHTAVPGRFGSRCPKTLLGPRTPVLRAHRTSSPAAAPIGNPSPNPSSYPAPGSPCSTPHASTSLSSLPPPPPPQPSAPPPPPTTPPSVPAPEPPSAAAAAADPCPRSQLLARRRERVTAEIIQAASRARLPASPDQLRWGLAALESLLPGGALAPNLDTLGAVDWARLATDPASVASKLVLLKSHYPRLDLGPALAVQPRLLMRPAEQLEREARQVRSLLSGAADPERLLSAVPELLSPALLVSVLVSINKWFHLERDPLEVLEADPDIVRRAQVRMAMHRSGTCRWTLYSWTRRATGWRRCCTIRRDARTGRGTWMSGGRTRERAVCKQEVVDRYAWKRGRKGNTKPHE
ncbi:hypothetical protein Agub_g10865 [Astrephomene gubernaculifera]|uniref:Uncharacterized protein n=1 Tax=Astrephomene gubernaculifera TaxID=47775 RepID=A0AAD3DVL5_9CHLO|nr:hypothetical protein Agub_g10865 [Astrephomene gubernaculifera]